MNMWFFPAQTENITTLWPSAPGKQSRYWLKLNCDSYSTACHRGKTRTMFSLIQPQRRLNPWSIWMERFMASRCVCQRVYTYLFLYSRVCLCIRFLINLQFSEDVFRKRYFSIHESGSCFILQSSCQWGEAMEAMLM